MTVQDLFETAAPSGESDVKRDHYGRYLLPVPGAEEEGDKAWTRATTFAKTISDTYTLDKWGLRMVAKGLALRPELYALAAATPLENKRELDQLCEDAKTAAGAKERSSLGTALHAFTEQADSGLEPTIPDPWKADVAAYTQGLAKLGILTRPEWIERRVVCQHFAPLLVAGTFDRINEIGAEPLQVALDKPPLAPGELVVGDLKTGRDLQYGWGEIAVQLAVYANGSHIWNRKEQRFEEMPPVRKDLALVYHLPVGEATLTVYVVDIELGWAAAKLCQQVRIWRTTRNLAHPILKLSVTPEGDAAPVELDWADRIRLATSDGELSTIWKDASARGEWTAALTKLGRARQAELRS